MSEVLFDLLVNHVLPVRAFLGMGVFACLGGRLLALFPSPNERHCPCRCQLVLHMLDARLTRFVGRTYRLSTAYITVRFDAFDGSVPDTFCMILARLRRTELAH